MGKEPLNSLKFLNGSKMVFHKKLKTIKKLRALRLKLLKNRPKA
jgi:hypothetical protein